MATTAKKSNVVKVEVRYVPATKIGEVFMKAQMGLVDGFLNPSDMDLVDMPGFEVSRRASNHPKNLETIYKHYQAIDGTPDERCTQLKVRSMTVGDCLVIEGTAYYVAPNEGFVTKDGSQLVPVTASEG
jgi:stage V sporulation protein SpoVS